MGVTPSLRQLMTAQLECLWRRFSRTLARALRSSRSLASAHLRSKVWPRRGGYPRGSTSRSINCCRNASSRAACTSSTPAAFASPFTSKSRSNQASVSGENPLSRRGASAMATSRRWPLRMRASTSIRSRSSDRSRRAQSFSARIERGESTRISARPKRGSTAASTSRTRN